MKTEKTNTFFYIWIIYFKQNIVYWCGHSIIGELYLTYFLWLMFLKYAQIELKNIMTNFHKKPQKAIKEMSNNSVLVLQDQTVIFKNNVSNGRIKMVKTQIF